MRSPNDAGTSAHADVSWNAISPPASKVLAMAPDADLAQWRGRAALLWRLLVTKRAHARLTRERDALEARLVTARLRRGRPVTLLPPRHDLRIRRGRRGHATPSR